MSGRVVTAVALLLMPLGCRQDSETLPREAAAVPAAASSADETPAGSDAATPAGSPADVIRRVNELRRTGRLTDLLQLVVEQQRPPIRDIVQAVDQLLLDNRVLQGRITSSVGPGVASLFDRSRVANVIDVFSHEVTVISEKISGESAEVVIQVGQRLPLSVVRLVREDGAWLIEPDPPIAGLADELRNLGKALRRAAQTVEAGSLTPAEIQKEMEFWQAPVLRRIDELVAASRAQQD